MPVAGAMPWGVGGCGLKNWRFNIHSTCFSLSLFRPSFYVEEYCKYELEKVKEIEGTERDMRKEGEKKYFDVSTRVPFSWQLGKHCSDVSNSFYLF